MRCACETMATTGMVLVTGEIRTQAYVDVPAIVREVLEDIGYNRAKYGFDATTCGVLNAIHDQSADIAQGVDQSFEAQKGEAEDSYSEIGAGDQGMMFGYACNETAELMPLPIYAAHRLSERLTKVRKEGILPYLRPDGKTQVSVRYENDKPVGIDKIVVSTQHSEDIDPEQLREDIIEQVIAPVFADLDLSYEGAEIFINPTGRFVIGGPMGDAALPAVRSSLTPMAAWVAMVAVRSRARTARRSIVLAPMQHAGSRRTWSQLALLIAARFRSLMLSVSRAPGFDHDRNVRHEPCFARRDRSGSREGVRSAPGSYHRCARPASSDLS